MKKLIFASLLFFACVSVLAQDSINVMTFNIRYNNPQDSLNSWPHRKDLVCSQINRYKVDILGVQEGLSDQVNDLSECLGTMDFSGVGRDDGAAAGEFSGIYYNHDKFAILDNGTFWLSKTPQVPGSKGWDAACTRICSWVKLLDRQTGFFIFVFNTHLDHVGKKARLEGMKIILSRIDTFSGRYPTILMGDMNTGTNDPALKQIAEGHHRVPLYNTLDYSLEKHTGPKGTFNNFKIEPTSDIPIDHIFVSNAFTVMKHATIAENFNGRVSSDHFPVFTQIKFHPIK